MDTPPTHPPSRHLAFGALGEDLAADHLEGLGWQVIARNWRIAHADLRGELDLVCRDRDVLVVVEVKARRTERFGAAVEAVGHRKQAKLRRLAAAFLRDTGVRASGVRFDVIGVLVDEVGVRIDHRRGAF